MFTKHPHPSKARRGVQIGLPVNLTDQPGPATPAKRSNQGELLNQLLDNKTLTCGFTAITAQPSSGVNFGSAQPVWYLLASFNPDNCGGEFFLNSLEMTLGPTDYKGDGGNATAPQADAVAWGDKLGRRAAIVIGENLRLPPDDGTGTAWVNRPFAYPGMFGPGALGAVDASGYTYEQDNPQKCTSVGDYLLVRDFPPGGLSDTQPFKWSIPKHWGAFGRRIGSGSSLDVAIVLSPGTLKNVADTPKVVYGYAAIQLYCGTQLGRGQFNE